MSSGERKRLLGMEAIDAALEELAQIAAREELPLLLVGGCALHFYGSERMTADLDVVSSQLPATLPHEEMLSFGGIKTSTPAGVPLDWIVRDDDFAQVYAEALSHGQVIDNCPIPVASPEHLAAMKMVAGRGKDELDLRALLVSPHIDLDKARNLIKRLLGAYAAKEFDALLAEAQWLASRGQ